MKILCILYDDPTDGMPTSYPMADLPKLDRYPDGMTLPSPKGRDFTPGELVTIPDSAIGGSSAPEIIIEIDSVPNGIEYLNPQTNTVDGHFGRHYLHKPELARNIGGGFQNTGDFLKQSKVLIDNKNFIFGIL